MRFLNVLMDEHRGFSAMLDVLEAIAGRMIEELGLRLSPSARAALGDYLRLRREQPNFANARSLRNALDRARLRQARRLLEAGRVDAGMLMTLEAEDIRASRVFDAARASGATEEAPC